MAIVFTGLTSGSDPTNNPSTTASISPTSGAQVFVAFASAVVGGDAANAADTFSVSGCNLTWVEVDRQIYGTRRTILVFRGYGTPSSGTLSLEQTYAATGTWTENMWSVVEVTGADETTPIGTSYSNSATYAGQPLTITVSETPDAGDMVFAAFGIGDAAASGTINSELSNEIHEQGGGEDVRTVLTAYDSSPDSTPVPGITWTGSNDAGGIAFIVNAAAGGPASITPKAAAYYRMMRNR